MKNAFYFIWKALFVLKTFKFLSFWSCRKINGLIWKIRLISELMTSHPDLQIMTIHILPNITQSKSNQRNKFCQLIKYNKGNILLQKSCIKWGRETSSRPLFVFWKSFIWSGQQLRLQAVSIIFDLAYNKSKPHEALDYWFRDMLSFVLLEKGLGIVSPPHFVYDFSRKMFLMLHFINWPNFIVWFSLLLEILGNMCIAIVC